MPFLESIFGPFRVPNLPVSLGFLDLRPLFWALFRRVLDRTFLFIFGPLLES
jgi:uncharacterized protein YggT (Ycf19 family)